MRTYNFCKILIISFSFIIFKIDKLNAQCPVTAIINPSTVVCGDPVSLTAVPDGCKPLNNNFNDGTIDVSGTQPWGSTNGATVQNGTGAHGCVGPPSEGAFSLWMGTTVAAPRAITTNGYDLTACSAVSATLCFDMKYGVQAGASPCEGIDLPEEGISVQYSIGGGAWQTLAYYDPNGGSDPNLTSWRRYCLDIPIAALGTNTAFRWYQDQSSGAGFDAWGLDNMVINLNVPGYTFDWAHDAQAPSSSPATPNVVVTSNSTYTVTYTNGVETCSSSVSVNVLAPTVTAVVNPSTVCPGSPVQLTAVSSLIANPPSNCGPSSLNCDPISTVAQEVQVGNGAILSQTGNPGIGYLGASNFDGAVRSQFILRAADLLAAGIRPGKFTSISFDVASNSAGSKLMNEFTITFMCTNLTALSGTSFINVASGTVVYSPKDVTITSGWQNLNFDQGYNWDGTSNLVINMCWRDYAPAVNANILTRHYATSYVATNTDGTNTSGAQDSYNCNVATGPFGPYSSLPNFKFGQCIPRSGNMNYSWTSSPAGFTSSIYNPVANPTVATTYTVSVNEASRPAACAKTATVSVTTYSPTVTVNPNPAEICNPATSVSLTATALSSVGLPLGPKTYNSSSSSAIAEGGLNNSCAVGGTVANNTIVVSGASPATVAANPVQSVTINMTCTRTSDYIFTLIAPDGSTSILIPQKGNGTSIATTLFPTGTALPATGNITGNFATANAFPSTGNVNGVWTLRVQDMCKPLTGSSTGTLTSWSIVFNSGSILWTPATSLSSTNSATTICSTTSNRTYTVTVTDQTGCSSSTTVPVTIGCVLPVELSEFKLDCNQDKVLINWVTVSQQNNDYFTLERSFDGVNYLEIKRFKGAGNSTIESSYNFHDFFEKGTSNPSIIYYRLSQTDFDGKTEVLSVRTIENCGNSNNVCVNTFPNPVDNYFVMVSTTGIRGEIFDLILYDMLGKVVYSRSIVPDSDNYSVKVELPTSIQKGVYLIGSKGGSDIKFCEQKIIVQ